MKRAVSGRRRDVDELSEYSALGVQFNSLGNNNGQHSDSFQPSHAGTESAAQGSYMGKHRTSSEQWNPGNVEDWDEDRYQSSWGSSPVGGGSDAPQAISPVQFSSPGTHDVWND